ncbi:hypothetical protein CsSME_00020223 [Camellia sinensis var. sinensis]
MCVCIHLPMYAVCVNLEGSSGGGGGDLEGSADGHGDGGDSWRGREGSRKLSGHIRGKSHGAVHELHDQPFVIQNSCWASLPPELLRDVIKRLEASENTWPARKHVVACAAVCRSWRKMCKESVQPLIRVKGLQRRVKVNSGGR